MLFIFPGLFLQVIKYEISNKAWINLNQICKSLDVLDRKIFWIFEPLSKGIVMHADRIREIRFPNDVHYFIQVFYTAGFQKPFKGFICFVLFHVLIKYRQSIIGYEIFNKKFRYCNFNFSFAVFLCTFNFYN